MSVCFNPINLNTFSPRKNIDFRYIQNIYLNCNINKHNLLDIIKFTFLDYCNLTVFGYNNINDEFWAKKICKNNYLLHFTLKIKSLDFEHSLITISPLVGNDEEIKIIYDNIKNMIDLYQSSVIIKQHIDNCI